MPTSVARRRRPDPERAGGFTLLEVVVALVLVSLVTALAVPMFARRLDSAFADAGIAQAGAGARMLGARAATLGVDIVLDAEAARRPLPDGRPALDLPAGWQVTAPRPVTFGRAGGCSGGEVTITDPQGGGRWRLTFAPFTGEVGVVAAGTP